MSSSAPSLPEHVELYRGEKKNIFKPRNTLKSRKQDFTTEDTESTELLTTNSADDTDKK